MDKYFKFIKKAWGGGGTENGKDECKERLETAAVMSDILYLFGDAGKFYFNQENVRREF